MSQLDFEERQNQTLFEEFDILEALCEASTVIQMLRVFSVRKPLDLT